MSGEYEVESILRAKVVSKRGKKSWLYWVKWKNYDIEDNTWEPDESFAGGSEHFIDHFWSRVDTNGRDYHNLRQFSADEEFLPLGPPRRSKAKKPAKVEIPSASAATNGDSENEVRSIIGDDEEPAAPPTSTRSKRRRSSTGGDTASSPPKPKRGRPPGKRPAELEAEEAAKAVTRKRSVPELPRLNRARARQQAAEAAAAATAESSTPARRQPLPRNRGRTSQAAPQSSSPSPDELLLQPEDNRKTRSSKGKTKSSVNPLDDHASRPETASQEAAMVVDDSEPDGPLFGEPSLLASASTPEAAPEPSTTPSIPAHRSRAANPRVKVLDDPNLTEGSGAISVKARFMKRNSAADNNDGDGDSTARPARVSKGKAGPGRSSSGLVVGGSRLVAQKGKLTTVKSYAATAVSRPSRASSSGNQNGDSAALGPGGLLFDSTEAEEVPGLGRLGAAPAPPKSPPTGQELLKEAGMDASAGDLPDFEEDAEGEDDIEFIHKPPRSQGTADPRGSEVLPANATENEVAAQQAPGQPPVVLEAKPVTFASRVTSAWSQSTIFGPLALGLIPSRNQTQDDSAESSSTEKRYTLNLNLDSAVSVPVMLKDTNHASESFLKKIDSVARNPTGKFYKDERAIALVNTLKPEGSYARVCPSDGVTEEQKIQFERFLARLLAGELFIQMNFFEPLVMFSSENSVIGQKLGVPAPLLGLVGTVVLAHVSIEDHCAYAEAAVHADDARW